MQKACKEFMELIRNEDFYKAHEVLESIWFPHRRSKEPKVLVLKGFINASVALELQRLGRRENALKVWKTFEKYRALIPECGEAIFDEVAAFLDGCYARYLS